MATNNMFNPDFVARVKAVLMEQTENKAAITRQKVAELLATEYENDADSLVAGVSLIAKSCPEFTSVAGRLGGIVRVADLADRKAAQAQKAAEKAAKLAAEAEAAKQA